MTRFARSKGSKSSNERAPEDSTPWEVMKEQLLQAKKESEESKKRKEAENQRIENYEKFLKEHKIQKRKATWCDFPATDNKKGVVTFSETDGVSMKNKKKKKDKEKVASEPEQSESVSDKNNMQNNISDNTKVSGKKPKKNKMSKQQVATESHNENISTGSSDNNQRNNKINKKQNIKPVESSTEASVPNINNSTIDTKENNNGTLKAKYQEVKAKNKKNKKLIDGKPVRRKEINDNSFQIIIHGKEIELVRFDGFPVMKKDAERLQELKTNMIKKGIPKSEVLRTMKLERRRAEKALARVKREVCYNCRKGGHVLSDCPELKSKIPGADAAEGVCFKCGSTEHRQFECKVQKDKEFRFATCFICKEPGHIARQCPDNPKGLYPNGGSCKLCGDVTHLRKDCPTIMDKKEESTVKLHTIDNSENIEDVGLQNNKLTPSELSKKPKKIKF